MLVMNWLLTLSTNFCILSTGCVFEEKTMVLKISPQSDNIQVLFIHEGYGRPKETGDDSETLLNAYRKRPGSIGSFLFLGDLVPARNFDNADHNNKELTFHDWHFYLDSNRNRQLCCFQTASIAHKGKILDYYSSIASGVLRTIESDFATVEARNDSREEFERWRKAIKDSESYLESHPLFQYWLLFGELLSDLDDASAKRLLVGATKNQRWFHFQAGKIIAQFPMTKECAERIKKNHEKKVQALFPNSDPIAFQASKDGLRIEIGSGKGETITLRYVYKTNVTNGLDEALLKAAGNPKAKQPHLTYDRKTNQFVADNPKMEVLTARHLICEFTKK